MVVVLEQAEGLRVIAVDLKLREKNRYRVTRYTWISVF